MHWLRDHRTVVAMLVAVVMFVVIATYASSAVRTEPRPTQALGHESWGDPAPGWWCWETGDSLPHRYDAASGDRVCTQAQVANERREPSTILLERSGRGTQAWTALLPAGRYGFHFVVTSGEAPCQRRLLLDGPGGTTVLVDSMRVPPVAENDAGDGLPTKAGDAPFGSGRRVGSGTYTLRLETDCPGPSHLWAWRFVAGPGT